MKEETIKIAGMSCGHCQAVVEKAVKLLPGITKVDVRVREGEAEVSFDESKTSLLNIKTQIEEAGYKVNN